MCLGKRFWIVPLIVIACCATFAGRAAAHLIEAGYLMELPPQRFHAVPPPLPLHGKEPDRIVERNIFCSGCMTSKAKESAVERAAEEAKREPQKTSLQVSLLAIVLAEDESLSRAVIRDLATPQKEGSLFGVGSKLFATNATVEHVYARRVYLKNGDQIEYLDLDDQAKTAAPPVTAPAHVAGNDSFTAALDSGLRCSGSNCQIDRSLVEQTLRNTTMLAGMARFVPTGRGFRVYAIKPNSLFARLGMVNGDTIRAINGNEMSTPDQALALYSKLRSASHLSLELERQGGRITLDYVIR
jgi:general secretion pathway protein C